MYTNTVNSRSFPNGQSPIYSCLLPLLMPSVCMCFWNYSNLSYTNQICKPTLTLKKVFVKRNFHSHLSIYEINYTLNEVSTK